MGKLHTTAHGVSSHLLPECRNSTWVFVGIACLLVPTFFVREAWSAALAALAATWALVQAAWQWRQSHTNQHLALLPADAQLALAAIEQSPESMAVVDFGGNLRYANQAFLQRSGYQLHEVLGQPAWLISSNGLSQAQRIHMRSVVEQGHVWRSVLSNRSKDGAEKQESVTISPVVDAAGAVTGFMELKQNVTELLQTHQLLAKVLNFDAVTLQPNRLGLSDKLEEMLKLAPSFPLEPDHWHALMLLDIDDFSKFNTGHGMQWADALLRAVAQKIHSLLPQEAWLARTAGDEFAVILPFAASNRLDARMAAYKQATYLQEGLSELQIDMEMEDASVKLSLGVGITVFPFTEPARKRDSEEHVYRRASMALRQAKSQGLGQMHAFSEALQESTQRKLAVEHGLYQALANDHLRMYVQKQVDINGKVCGVEALLRWQPPGEATVPPSVFIPVAEASDLIVQLGDWMLERAVQVLSHPLVRTSGMWVAVNISARQFGQADFVDKIANLITRANLQPGRLSIEITESMVLHNVQEAIRTITRLQALGVYCALDDFGTGYSSLSYLHRLPINEIKIDQSFIHHLDPSTKSATLVQALLMVANSLQLRVVAEGVEDADQAALLRAWYPAILCQGYLYSRPVPVQEWLQELSQQALSGPSD